VNLKLHFMCGYFLLGTVLIYSKVGMAKEAVLVPISTILEDKILELNTSYSMGKYQDVVNVSKKLLLLDSSNKEVKDLYAISNYKLKNYKSIIDLYTEHQAEYLDSPLQLKLRSIAMVKEKKFLLAMRNFRTLKSLTSLNPEWKAFYHYLVFKINPKSSFEELKRMSEGSSGAASDLTLGKLYLIAGKNDKAIQSFKLSLEKESKNVESLEYLGDSYFKNKKLGRSISAYSALLKIEPNNAQVKIKLATSYIKKDQLINAIKVLESDNNSKVVNLRERLSAFVNNYLNNSLSRSIAEEKTRFSKVAIQSENKLVLEEKFIPNDMDLALNPNVINNSVELEASPDVQKINNSVVLQAPAPDVQKANKINSLVALETSPDLPSTKNNNVRVGDISVLELSIGVKSKKYDLLGTGFNVKADYSMGGVASFKYTFFPVGRNWNSQISLDHSSVKVGNLQGLSPTESTLSESRLTTGINYFINNFSIGPFLMYENISAIQTTPSILRGNINFFNFGVRGGYLIHIKNNFKLSLEASYFSKIMSVSKTTSIGTAEKRTLMDISTKLYYKIKPNINYFIGLGFLQTNTTYSGSSVRGTSEAREQEKDFTFPIGIKYEF